MGYLREACKGETTDATRIYMGYRTVIVEKQCEGGDEMRLATEFDEW